MRDRDFDAFNALGGTPGLQHAADGSSTLTMEVNGEQQSLLIRSCAGVDATAAGLCGDWSLAPETCATLTAHFRRACRAAEVHAAAVDARGEGVVR